VLRVLELFPSYMLELWKKVTEIRNFKGYQFESQLDPFLKTIGFTNLTQNELGKKYVEGASGVSHEVDICAFNPDTKELLIGECKTGQIVRYGDILKFIVKSQDLSDKLTIRLNPYKVTKVIISTNNIDANGYKICWFYGIIPIQCSLIPFYLARPIIQEKMENIEKSEFFTHKTKEDINNTASNILNKIDSYLINVGIGKQCNLKLEKEINSEINDIDLTLTEYKSTLDQLNELGFRIPTYLANLIISGKVQTRQSYIEAKNQLLYKFRLGINSLSDYEILKLLIKDPININIVSTILPLSFYSYQIAASVSNREIQSADDFRERLQTFKKLSGVHLNNWSIMEAAYMTMEEEQISKLVNFYIQYLEYEFTQLRYEQSRHIIKQLKRKGNWTSQQLLSYISKTNNIARFSPLLSSTDIVRYAKGKEFKILIKYFPREIASRWIADLIILNKIHSKSDYSLACEEVSDLYWLDQIPSYKEITDTSPVTKKTLGFFNKIGIYVKPTMIIEHEEVVSVNKEIEYFSNLIRTRKITNTRLCKSCRRNVSSRMVKVALDFIPVCKECYNFLYKIRESV